MESENTYIQRLLELRNILQESTNTKIFLRSTYLPHVETIIGKLQLLLDNAEKNRRNCLIAKTTGTSVGAVGMGIAIAGVMATPFTGGLSLVAVAPIGAALGLSGAATTVGTSITDMVIENQDKADVTKLLDSYREVEAVQIRQFCEILNIVPLGDQELLLGLLERFRGSPGTPGVAGCVNEEVTVKELKEGDHIFRPIPGVVILYHHGVVIKCDGRLMVIDFGQKGKRNANEKSLRDNGSEVALKTIEDFCEGQEKDLKRRTYNSSIPVGETVRIATLVLEGAFKSFEDKYNLFTNNCEHFATYLKTGVHHSDQTTRAGNICSGVKTIAKPIIHTVMGANAIGTAIARTSTSSSAVLNFFIKPFSAAPAMSGFTKFCIVLGPIGTALDIGMLVYEFKKNKTNVALIRSTRDRLEELKEWVVQCEEEIEQFIEIIQERIRNLENEEFERQLKQRLEEERLRQNENQNALRNRPVTRFLDKCSYLWNTVKSEIFNNA